MPSRRKDVTSVSALVAPSRPRAVAPAGAAEEGAGAAGMTASQKRKIKRAAARKRAALEDALAAPPSTPVLNPAKTAALATMVARRGDVPAALPAAPAALPGPPALEHDHWTHTLSPSSVPPTPGSEVPKARAVDLIRILIGNSGLSVGAVELILQVGLAAADGDRRAVAELLSHLRQRGAEDWRQQHPY